MIGAILLLGLSRAILPGEPPAFQNYFDDSVKGVDISQDSAIKACLQNGDAFADKVKAAYNKCFGNDYDFDDLASAVGSSDEDSDGLPDSFEGNEACFYEEMGWVAGSGAADADADAIKADMAGLDAGLSGDFDANIDACAAWSGSFGSRVRREAVPDLMGSGRAALNWLRSAVRKTRSADPEKEKESGKGKGKGKKNTPTEKKGTRKSGKKSAKKDGKKKGTRKSGKKSARKDGKKKARKSGKKSAKKNGKKKGTRKSGKKSARKDGKKKARKSGKKSARKDGKKKARKSGKKSAKTNEKKSDKKEKTSDKKEKKVLDEQTYNKLWCFDLSMEQVLEKCVEEKIKN